MEGIGYLQLSPELLVGIEGKDMNKYVRSICYVRDMYMQVIGVRRVMAMLTYVAYTHISDPKRDPMLRHCHA